MQNKEEVKSENKISNQETNFDDLNGVIYGAYIIEENTIIKKIEIKDIMENIINYFIK